MTAITRTAWVWRLLALSGCSLLVDPGSFVIKCEVLPGRESEDPCLPAGMHCVASECKPCKGGVETCNGEDDDCDGVVDNGQDEDGDGFTWCGGLVRELADCVDSDPAIHPAGAPGPDGSIVPAPKEACDGKDNDCDSKVDEAPECAAMHSCVEDGCIGDRRCDEKTGVCIEPRPVGSGCKLDSECAGGFCVHSGDFGLTTLKDNRCASACCSDTDCASGSVCVVVNQGARLCLPASIAGRATKVAGDRCARDAECASGACDRMRCAARCSSEAACRTNVCYLSPGSLTEPRLWLCGDAQGLQPNGGTCLLLSCRSGLCTDRNVCAKPCGRSADCSSDEICGYSVVRPPLAFNQMSVAPACEPRSNSGTPGDRLCCTNADCAEGQLCSPKAVDPDIWVMTCR
jgi:hypothetical protein